jgi:hypothetical protein
MGIIQIDDKYYGLYRSLKRSKVKESCTSRIRVRTGSNQDIQQLINQPIIDDALKYFSHHTLREEVITKNESDLQQLREQLVPPREVFTTTQMLTQDAEHIFQMQPAQRVEVFKHIFGMIGIDGAKEIVQDHRRSLQQRIHIKQDYSRATQQLVYELNQLFGILTLLPGQIFSQLVSFHQDAELWHVVKEQLSIEQYHISESWSQECHLVTQQLQQELSRISAQESIRNQLSQQLQQSSKAMQQIQQQIQQLQQQQSQIQIATSTSLDNSWEQLQHDKTHLSTQLQQLLSSIPVATIRDLVNQHQEY